MFMNGRSTKDSAIPAKNRKIVYKIVKTIPPKIGIFLRRPPVSYFDIFSTFGNIFVKIYIKLDNAMIPIIDRRIIAIVVPKKDIKRFPTNKKIKYSAATDKIIRIHFAILCSLFNSSIIYLYFIFPNNVIFISSMNNMKVQAIGKVSKSNNITKNEFKRKVSTTDNKIRDNP